MHVNSSFKNNYIYIPFYNHNFSVLKSQFFISMGSELLTIPSTRTLLGNLVPFLVGSQMSRIGVDWTQSKVYYSLGFGIHRWHCNLTWEVPIPGDSSQPLHRDSSKNFIFPRVFHDSPPHGLVTGQSLSILGPVLTKMLISFPYLVLLSEEGGDMPAPPLLHYHSPLSFLVWLLLEKS